jgi:hypothetical protein
MRGCCGNISLHIRFVQSTISRSQSNLFHPCWGGLSIQRLPVVSLCSPPANGFEPFGLGTSDTPSTVSFSSAYFNMPMFTVNHANVHSEKTTSFSCFLVYRSRLLKAGSQTICSLDFGVF